MVDIADIGFKADTSSLEKGTASLEKLKRAAKGVTPNIELITKSFQKVATIFAGAASGMAKSNLALVSATKGVSAAQIKAARDASNFANEIYKTSKMQDKLTLSVNRATTALKSQSTAAVRTQTTLMRINRLTGVSGLTGGSAQQSAMFFKKQGMMSQMKMPAPALDLARDQMPNRFNTGNIAAQFQDVGVTAAMGMNPLTIALQQGTQLSAVMNSMKNPLKGLVEALKMVFNATSLLTIGFIAIIATIIQMVNWGKVAKGMLSGLADVLDVVGPYAIVAAAGLTLLYSPAILTGIGALTLGILKLGATAALAAAEITFVWLATLSPITLTIAAIAAVLLVAVNISDVFRNLANKIIGTFVGLKNSIGMIFEKGFLGKLFASFMINATNVLLQKVTTMINFVIEKMNFVAKALRQEEIKLLDGSFKIPNPFEGTAGDIGKSIKKEIIKALDDDYIGIIGEKLTNVISSATSKLRNMSKGVSDEEGKAGSKKDPWEELTKGADRQLKTLEAQLAAVGQTAYETARLKYETNLLNEAQRRNIELTPEQTTKIKELAAGLANADVTATKAKEAFDFAKNAGRSFFGDLKSSLIEGKSLWESFGNAVLNVLNKIFDRIMNSGVDLLFDAMGPSIKGFFGGSTAKTPAVVESAKGNVFSPEGINKFANGGAFTNSIVSKPTFFKFANGSKIGEMGEAGAEAIMPLHRGPDGSLGVKAVGSNDNAEVKVIININNNSKADVSVNKRQTSQGLEIDVMIDELVSEKLSQQGSSTNRALNVHNSRKMISR